MTIVQYLFEPETPLERAWAGFRRVRFELAQLGRGFGSSFKPPVSSAQTVKQTAHFSTEVEMPGRRTIEHLRALEIRLDELLPVSPTGVTIYVLRLPATSKETRRYRVGAIDDSHVEVATEELRVEGQPGLVLASKFGAARAVERARNLMLGLLGLIAISAFASTILEARFQQAGLVVAAEFRQANLELLQSRRAAALANSIQEATRQSMSVSEVLALSTWLVDAIPVGVTLVSVEVVEDDLVARLSGDVADGDRQWAQPPEGFSYLIDSASSTLRIQRAPEGVAGE
jgi:hypothetical protein